MRAITVIGYFLAELVFCSGVLAEDTSTSILGIDFGMKRSAVQRINGVECSSDCSYEISTPQRYRIKARFDHNDEIYQVVIETSCDLYGAERCAAILAALKSILISGSRDIDAVIREGPYIKIELTNKALRKAYVDTLTEKYKNELSPFVRR
jgi:hypothetical protein